MTPRTLLRMRWLVVVVLGIVTVVYGIFFAIYLGGVLMNHTGGEHIWAWTSVMLILVLALAMQRG